MGMRANYSDEELLNAFKNFYIKNGFIPKTKEFTKLGLAGSTTYFNRFGSIKNILKLLNIEVPRELKGVYEKQYELTDDELLHIMRIYYDTIGFPTQRKFNSKNNLPAYGTYWERFGSFKNAILMSGIKIPKERERFFDRESLTNEEMLRLLDYFTKEKLKNNIYLLTNDEIDNIENMPSCSVYVSRFGGVVNAYKLIDIDYHMFNKNALEEDMKLKYTELKNKLGRVPNSRDLDRASQSGECYAMNTYENHFGKLVNIQNIMGDIPTILGKNLDEDEAIERLKDLGIRLGRTPIRQDICDCDWLPSDSFYYRKFGSYSEALKLAGFEPNTKIYITNKGNKALSYLEYKFLNMIEKFNLKFRKEVYYRKIIEGFKRNFRFDFILELNNKIYFIEIFGIENNDFYNNRKEEKIKICKDKNIPLIDLYKQDIICKSETELFNLLQENINNLNYCNRAYYRHDFILQIFNN
jgi:hypothetical protein